MMRAIIFQSIAITIASLLAYRWGLKNYGMDNLIIARTIVFATLISAELFRAYSSRSSRHSVFKIGVFSNKTLNYAVLFSFLLLFAAIYVPFLQKKSSIPTPP